MPAVNCSVVDCGSCRRTKGLSIFKLPASRNKAYKIWRENWLSELTKYRVVDAEFKALIENGSVYTCEKHFKPEEIETCKLFIFVYIL